MSAFVKKSFMCPHHATMVAVGSDGCAACIIHYVDAPDAETMSPDDRMAEMRDWCGGILTVEFSLVHKRIEQLVGRSVWTHEMGLNWDELVVEAGHRNAPTMGAIVDLLTATGKPVVVLIREDER